MYSGKYSIRYSATNITNHCCIQKMWLGGQTESFQNVGGAKVDDVLTFQKFRGAIAHLGGKPKVYDVLTFQKSRGARAHL